ncbi:hemicentin-2-like isoform X1 [Haliotis rufescens]|uniref:hemicentin-2-like isoform X1 n=1 Tax=Haliotis rufescens TaxID=6454 RepID=UPI00201F2F9C|nr:hemicentin-2-like isoform X1 [Haliotis rufescens]
MMCLTFQLILCWCLHVLTEPVDLPPPEPEFLTVPNNITVREGELAKLPCSVLHLGTKQVGWKRVDKGHMTTIGTMTWVKDRSITVDHIEKSEEVSDWNLMIKNVQPLHAGMYECQITTPEKLRRKVQLNVFGPPITDPDISIMGKEYVETGEDIRLVCNATGGPHIPEEIDWFKDGDKIDTKKYRNILITKYRSLHDRSMVSELIIDRSTLRDSGTYICRSSSDEIDSKRVTVLFGDSPRWEREPQNEEGTPFKDRESGASRQRYSQVLLLLLLFHIYQSSCT